MLMIQNNNDRKAYREIARRHKDKLLNFVFRFTGNIEDAEDFTQETFLKLWDSKHLYKNVGKFSTWFYTIAVNMVKNSNQRKHLIEFVSLYKFEEDEPENINMATNILTPEEFANSRTESPFIQKAIDSLDDVFKEVIILRYIWNYEYEEISELTGIPLGTVKSRISRGHQILAKKLDKFYKFIKS